MKLLTILLFFSLPVCGQDLNDSSRLFAVHFVNQDLPVEIPQIKEPSFAKTSKWKLDNRKLIAGGFVLTAGATKGFNETLTFHWKRFRKCFPKANPMWFNPNVSWRNKYKNGNPQAGAKFPLSTSVLVAFTDQYHLNNFVNRLSWTSALVINISEGKKPFKHYLLDALFYTLCHQAGFAATYYPFKSR